MVAGRYNPRTIGNLPFRQDETDLQATAGLSLSLFDENSSAPFDRSSKYARLHRHCRAYSDQLASAGASVFGSKITKPAIGFELAIRTAPETRFSMNNDNDKPAVSATAIVRFPRDSWLMVAGRYNPRTIGDLPFRQDETDLQGTAGLHIAIGPVSLGGAAIFQPDDVRLDRRPVATSVRRPRAGDDHDPPRTSRSRSAIQFGVLDPSSLITTDMVMEHTAGVVLGVPSYRMRLQLQVTHVVEQAARDLSNDRVQLAAEVVL